MFEKAKLKIIEINKRKRNNQNIGHESTLEEVIESVKPSNKRNTNKYMTGKALSHPTCHPKDAYRKRLQIMFNETCKEKFKYTLEIDKCMIACHNPDNIRILIITQSSLKNVEE